MPPPFRHGVGTTAIDLGFDLGFSSTKTHASPQPSAIFLRRTPQGDQSEPEVDPHDAELRMNARFYFSTFWILAPVILRSKATLSGKRPPPHCPQFRQKKARKTPVKPARKAGTNVPTTARLTRGRRTPPADVFLGLAAQRCGSGVSARLFCQGFRGSRNQAQPWPAPATTAPSQRAPHRSSAPAPSRGDGGPA